MYILSKLNKQWHFGNVAKSLQYVSCRLDQSISVKLREGNMDITNQELCYYCSIDPNCLLAVNILIFLLSLCVVGLVHTYVGGYLSMLTLKALSRSCEYTDA